MDNISPPPQLSELEYKLLRMIKPDEDTDFVCSGNGTNEHEEFKLTIQALQRFHSLGFVRFGGFQKKDIGGKLYVHRYTVKKPNDIQKDMIATTLNHPEIYLENPDVGPKN